MTETLIPIVDPNEFGDDPVFGPWSDHSPSIKVGDKISIPVTLKRKAWQFWKSKSTTEERQFTVIGVLNN